MKDDGRPAVPPEPRRGPVAAAMIGLVRAYRFAISPLFAPSCRYWPSCSEYAIEALQRHGALRGGLAAAARLLRCNPWSAGGVDPVPLALRPLAPRPFSLRRSSSDARWRAYREPSASEPPTTESSPR